MPCPPNVRCPEQRRPLVSGGADDWKLLPDLNRGIEGGKRYVPLDLLRARLEACEPCPERRGHSCSLGRALDVEASGFPGMAQYAREGCPRRRWPGEIPDCKELGRALTRDEAVALGVDLSTCGCLNKLRRCAVHGVCTTASKRAGVSCCADCPDHTEREPVQGPPMEPKMEPEPNVKELSAELIERSKARLGQPVRVEVRDLIVPPVRTSQKPIEWAVGVTTVPERRSSGLLLRTVDSLRAAGFGAMRLFADGARDVEDWEKALGLPVTVRSPAMRIHGNFVLGVMELFIRQPHADFYAMFQDDLQAVRNLRRYLELNPPPESGYGNLYLHAPPVQSPPPNKPGWFLSNQLGRGALGLVFPRPALLALLHSEHMALRPMDPGRGSKAIDGGVVDSLRKAGFCEWAHNPSLLRHADSPSTLGNRKYREAPTWPGEEFDALSLIKGEERAAG